MPHNHYSENDYGHVLYVTTVNQMNSLIQIISDADRFYLVIYLCSLGVFGHQFFR